MKKNKLHNIKNSGFKAPNQYFDTLEDHIINELKLKERSHTSGFKAPDNYFDSLEETILNKVSRESKPKVFELFSNKTIVYASSIAAAVLLLISLSLFDSKISFDDLDNETVENYLLYENIDSYEIASFLNEEDLKEENFVEFNIDEEVVEDYIFDNLDVEDLY
ncbi:hypothetical protein E1J38_011305 [Seonamhaeicola sediminis]|uniref:DUF3379 domain-containing protein n=1 Tax=Seonamhaeicola sediminis TaxID=2528206 RepID=A0A562YC34_9FLAO|nr:hypothetical protein [Seonamhaeicola sediminis]TWO31960.1 hypothetical protein E1J38_011305 [Seonamhaeicola sediminis]